MCSQYSWKFMAGLACCTWGPYAGRAASAPPSRVEQAPPRPSTRAARPVRQQQILSVEGAGAAAPGAGVGRGGFGGVPSPGARTGRSEQGQQPIQWWRTRTPVTFPSSKVKKTTTSSEQKKLCHQTVCGTDLQHLRQTSAVV